MKDKKPPSHATQTVAPHQHRAHAANEGLPLVIAAFAMFGFLYGVWQVVIADLQHALRLSDGALGSAITIGFLAAFPVMLVGGRLADRWGARVLIAGTTALMACAFGGLFFVDRYWMLVALLLLFFGASGAYDVGINAAAIHVEQRRGHFVMASVHAAFSGTAAVMALVTGGLLFAGVSFQVLYLLVALGMLGLAVVVWRSNALAQPAPPRAPNAMSLPASSLYRLPLLLLLAGITALAFLSEGTLETWSAIYLRSALDLPAVIGAAGPAVVHTAMLVGQLGTARVVQRWGRRALLRGAGVVAAGGMALALLTTVPPIILLGLLLSGLALAGVAPTAFSLAGDAVPDRAGQVSSVITTVGYSGFLIGPALIGGLAELLGLRSALAMLILIGGCILLLSMRINEPRRAS